MARCSRCPHILQQGLERAAYTNITWTQKEQQLFYTAETDQDLVHWRGKKKKMWKWKEKDWRKYLDDTAQVANLQIIFTDWLKS